MLPTPSTDENPTQPSCIRITVAEIASPSPDPCPSAVRMPECRVSYGVNTLPQSLRWMPGPSSNTQKHTEVSCKCDIGLAVSSTFVRDSVRKLLNDYPSACTDREKKPIGASVASLTSSAVSALGVVESRSPVPRYPRYSASYISTVSGATYTSVSTV